MMLENRLSFSTSSLKKWFLRLTFPGLVIGAMVAPQMLSASSRAQEAKPRDGSKIYLLVEKGFVLPPQPLATLKSLDGSNWDQRPSGTSNPNGPTPMIFAEAIELPQQFKTDSSNTGDSHRTPWTTFTISGGARFESQLADGSLAVVPTENGVIMTPAIVAGSELGAGVIQVLVNGQAIVENLRVATVDVGDIEKLKKYVPDGDPALLVSGDHYAVLDESKVTSKEAVSWLGTDPVGKWPGPSWPGPSWPGPSWPGPSGKEPTKQEEAASAGDQVEALGLAGGETFEPVIAAHPMPDGRLEVFAVGRGGSPIYHKYQLAPNSGWSAWKSLQGITDSFNISVAPNQDGRLTIFVRGTDGAVWFKYQSRRNDPESWTPWITLYRPDGFLILGDPVAVLNGTNCIEVFAQIYHPPTGNSRLYRQAQTAPNGGWGSWILITSDPYMGINTAALGNTGRISVFSGRNYIRQTSAGSAFYDGLFDLGRSIGYLAAMTNDAGDSDDGDIDLVGVSDSSELWYGAPGHGWDRMGNGVTFYKPALARDNSGRLAAFVHGTDDYTYWSRQVSPGSVTWSYWRNLGGVAVGNPAAAVNKDGRLEVFVLGTDSRIYHAYETSPGSGNFTLYRLLLP